MKETDSKSSSLASIFTGVKPFGGTSYTIVTEGGGGGLVVVVVVALDVVGPVVALACSLSIR